MGVCGDNNLRVKYAFVCGADNSMCVLRETLRDASRLRRKPQRDGGL